MSVRIPDSSLLSPAPGSNFRRSTAVFLSSRNDTFELRHYLRPSRTGTRLSRNKLSGICRVHAPRAPHPLVIEWQIRRGTKTTRVWWSQPAFATTDEITSLRKLQLYALLGKTGGVEGAEGSQHAVEIMIIGGISNIISIPIAAVKCCEGWWRCVITHFAWDT